MGCVMKQIHFSFEKCQIVKRIELRHQKIHEDLVSREIALKLNFADCNKTLSCNPHE
jgi:hypothetical protein